MGTIIHTSPKKITKLHKNGMFGDVLFFSYTEYVMTSIKNYFIYTMEIDEDKILKIGTLFYKHTADNPRLKIEIQHVIDVLEVNRETAENLLDQSISTFDIELDSCPGEAGWFVQQKQAEIAKTLGYKGVELTDEQGVVIAICMTDRENELKLITET